MKKVLTWIVGIVVVFGIIGNMMGDEEPTEEVATDEPETEEATKEETETVEADPMEEETNTNEIKLDDELLFGEFKVNMKDINVYEEDNKTYADLSFSWLNQSNDGKKTFMQLSLLDVKQGDNILEETTGAGDIENSNSSDVYFPNAQNGEWTVELTYELVNDEPLTIIFTPMNDVEDSQEVNIDIK